MDGNINEFVKAFHASEDCARISAPRPNGYGALVWDNIFECAESFAREYCDAQLKAYHRWTTTGELP